MTKKILVVSDLHCGQEVGLTPPEWNPKYTKPERQKASDYRKALWDRYTWTLDNYGPFDVCFANGDLIDGRGEASGSLELIELDRQVQAEMAIRCLERTGAKEYFLTLGTDYHVGQVEKFEVNIAKALNAKYGEVLAVEVNGTTFNLRHFIGGGQGLSGNPNLYKELIWAMVWNVEQDNEMQDVYIRSHAHRYMATQVPGRLAMITPALQGRGTHYGLSKMSGTVNFGCVVFDVYGKEDYSWRPILFPHPSHPVHQAAQ